MKIPSKTLVGGKRIPSVGLGLWQVKNEQDFNTAFNSAAELGYRHFDSAQAYENEQMLGSAWKKSGLKREEIFITTKIKVQNFGYKKVHSSFKESLKRLQTDHVDLVLLHFPLPLRRKKAWEALEEIKAAGGALNIGVSNYEAKHLKYMESYAKEMPAVNQIEMHIFLQQAATRAYCKAKDILIEAYSPLAHGEMMDNKIVQSIAEKHNKTYAQIMLRWLIEQDVVILPKSVTPKRIKENIEIFDFELDQDDKAQLAKQNLNKHTLFNTRLVP